MNTVCSMEKNKKTNALKAVNNNSFISSTISKCDLSGSPATIQYFKGVVLPLSQLCLSHQIPHIEIDKNNVKSGT